MGFSDSLFNLTGGIMPSAYRISILGEKRVYIEGVLKIIDITDKKIVVLVKNNKLKIIGENLKILSYFEKDLSVIGEIFKIERDREK